MKASELTLGSWVIATNNGVCPLPGKIAEMLPRAGRVVGIDGDCVWLSFVDFGFMLDAIEPVELTAEILKKNGFENTSVIIVGTPKMRWVSEDERTEITIWIDDTTPMEIRKNVYYEDEETYTLPSPVCVHELQNAIRLCGIDKEVQL